MTKRKRVLLLAAGVAVVPLAVVPLALVLYTLAANRPSAAERTARMPGDALIPRPMFAMTQAVTIDAPPERVWPWLAQMGAGRAGWYSYDAIDNAGTPSARTVLPQHQRLAPGDLLPGTPGATDGFLALAVDAPNDLVLGGPPDAARGQRATWEFLLRPLGGRTRLVVRVRVADHWLSGAPPPDPARPRRLVDHLYAVMARLPKPVLFTVAGFGHRVMENEQLRGIRWRAERGGGRGG